jgi:hypothetical protein
LKRRNHKDREREGRDETELRRVVVIRELVLSSKK